MNGVVHPHALAILRHAAPVPVVRTRSHLPCLNAMLAVCLHTPHDMAVTRLPSPGCWLHAGWSDNGWMPGSGPHERLRLTCHSCQFSCPGLMTHVAIPAKPRRLSNASRLAFYAISPSGLVPAPLRSASPVEIAPAVTGVGERFGQQQATHQPHTAQNKKGVSDMSTTGATLIFRGRLGSTHRSARRRPASRSPTSIWRLTRGTASTRLRVGAGLGLWQADGSHAAPIEGRPGVKCTASASRWQYGARKTRRRWASWK